MEFGARNSEFGARHLHHHPCAGFPPNAILSCVLPRLLPPWPLALEYAMTRSHTSAQLSSLSLIHFHGFESPLSTSLKYTSPDHNAPLIS